MKPTLLILAAGMGSRYGGIKQIDRFGPNGETIIDYSIYDAIRAGFGKVVLIVREEIKKDVEALFVDKLKGKIELDFAIQGYESYLPEDIKNVKREKPWGTGHAVLCAWEQTKTPFAVINADDFYGAEAFEKMAKFLSEDENEDVQAMVGYHLKNTLSENGSVSRGVCFVSEDGFLEEVNERTKIERMENGQIAYFDSGEPEILGEDTVVSMNFWGFKQSVFPEIEKQFHNYARENIDAAKAEFYIPSVMSTLMKEEKSKCKVFTNSSDWFGVTYPEDKETVNVAITALVDKGEYPDKLWG